MNQEQRKMLIEKIDHAFENLEMARKNKLITEEIIEEIKSIIKDIKPYLN